jgi:ribonuclease HI
MAINQAIGMIGEEQLDRRDEGDLRLRTYTILTDSSRRSVQLANQLGSPVSISFEQSTMQHKFVTQKIGATIHLGWVPSHEGILGNEIADKEAKASIDLSVGHGFLRLKSSQRRWTRTDILRQ